MSKFKDRHGNEYDTTMTLLVARRVDASDFTAVYKEKFTILNPPKNFLHQLFVNGPLASAIVFSIIIDQVAKVALTADEYKVFKSSETGSDEYQPLYEKVEEFYLDSIDGDTLDRIREALVTSLANFIPDHKTALLQSLKQFIETRTTINQEIERASEEAKDLIQEEIREIGSQELKELTKKMREVRPKTSPGEVSSESPLS
jgi:hypothetical protein